MLQAKIDAFHASIKAQALIIAIEWAGGVRQLAERLGYTRYAVQKFVYRKQLSVVAALVLERLEGFPLTASEMRPDVDMEAIKARKRCPHCMKTLRDPDSRTGYSSSFNDLSKRLRKQARQAAQSAARRPPAP